MVPKITASSIAAQREHSQQLLIDAALRLALSKGQKSLTVTSVAKEAGLSRSAFYEYFASAADLVADLILEELENFNARLNESISDITDPYKYIESWISEALIYVVDGRHILAKSLNAIADPDFRKSEIELAHMQMISAMRKPLVDLGIEDIGLGLTYINKTIEAATVRIEGGNEPAPEIQYAKSYAVAGIQALVQLSRKA